MNLFGVEEEKFGLMLVSLFRIRIMFKFVVSVGHYFFFLAMLRQDKYACEVNYPVRKLRTISSINQASNNLLKPFITSASGEGKVGGVLLYWRKEIQFS
jgi:hypothetical protein